ncbi:MAG TPA: hypothetical protein VK911_17790, partial [Vicinamibacterales bacterium]|nr:hypothetical protein [Vicinamibacterales bacterium]
MTAAVQVLRKDVVQHRVLIAAWLACLAADVVLAVTPLDAVAAGGGWLPAFRVLRLLLTGGTAYLGAIVALAAVQSDPSTDTTAFWLTRPIARRDLL